MAQVIVDNSNIGGNGNTNITFQASSNVTFYINGPTATNDLSIASGAILQLSSTASSSINLTFANGLATQQALIAGNLIINSNNSNNNTFTTTTINTGTGVVVANGGAITNNGGVVNSNGALYFENGSS